MNFDQALNTIKKSVTLFNNGQENDFRICIIVCDQMIEALSMSVIEHKLSKFSFQDHTHDISEFEALVFVCRKDLTEKIKILKKLNLITDSQQRCISMVHEIRNTIHHYKYDQSVLFSKISSYLIIKISCEITKSITNHHFDKGNYKFYGYSTFEKESLLNAVDEEFSKIAHSSKIIDNCNEFYEELDENIFSAERLFSELHGGHDIDSTHDAVICGYITSIEFFEKIIKYNKKELIHESIDKKIEWVNSNRDKFQPLYHLLGHGGKYRCEEHSKFIIENAFYKIYEKSKFLNYLNNSNGGNAGISIVEDS